MYFIVNEAHPCIPDYQQKVQIGLIDMPALHGATLSDAVAAATEVISQTDSRRNEQTIETEFMKEPRQSGVLSNVKAQIRKEFINCWRKVKILSEEDRRREWADLQTHCLSSAYHLLKKRGYKHSLSVPSAESGG